MYTVHTHTHKYACIDDIHVSRVHDGFACICGIKIQMARNYRRITLLCNK